MTAGRIGRMGQLSSDRAASDGDEADAWLARLEGMLMHPHVMSLHERRSQLCVE